MKPRCHKESNGTQTSKPYRVEGSEGIIFWDLLLIQICDNKKPNESDASIDRSAIQGATTSRRPGQRETGQTWDCQYFERRLHRDLWRFTGAIAEP
jgi:hypothetical protein